jgi:hypothetical protein
MPTGGKIVERKIRKLIKKLNRIMNTWEYMVIRRTIVNIFSIILFSQLIITTIFWIYGRSIGANWLGLMIGEMTAWGTMLAFYFKGRKEETEND